MADSSTAVNSGGSPDPARSGIGCLVIRTNCATSCSPLRRSKTACPVPAQNSVAASPYTSAVTSGACPCSTSGAV